MTLAAQRMATQTPDTLQNTCDYFRAVICLASQYSLTTWDHILTLNDSQCLIHYVKNDVFMFSRQTLNVVPGNVLPFIKCVVVIVSIITSYITTCTRILVSLQYNLLCLLIEGV